MRPVLFLFFLFLSILAYSQDKKNPDALLGTWLTGEGNGMVEIYKNGDRYQGKIVWLKEPLDIKTGKPKTDVNHPDKSVHERPVLGLVNLWGFVYTEQNKWDKGHIYDPKNGKEYKCVITLKDQNTLDVRGYIGFTLIGRTDTWKRQAAVPKG
jgi:uncharacterized protein (DUF2147 family)